MFVVAALGCAAHRYLLLGVVRACRHVLAEQVVSVVGALVQLAFAADADVVTDHVPRHVVRLHRGRNGRASLLLHDLPLLNLHLLVYGGHAGLVLIVVVLDVDGLAGVAAEHHVCGVLLGETLHRALLIVGGGRLVGLTHAQKLLVPHACNHVVFFGASERAMHFCLPAVHSYIDNGKDG